MLCINFDCLPVQTRAMSASHSEKKVADSVPEAKSEGVSCARATWKAWVFSLIAISLVSVIAASGSISYDPDSYAITPMLPDGDFRTECDGNHVCQGLRAALSFYSFTVCFFALGALYLFAFKPTMVRRLQSACQFRAIRGCRSLTLLTLSTFSGRSSTLAFCSSSSPIPALSVRSTLPALSHIDNRCLWHVQS